MSAPNPTEITAELLFHAVRDRDDQLLGALLQKLTPWLSAQARRAGAKGSEIDEVVQDAWIAALAATEEFHAEGALLPWLATVVRHRVVTLRRAQRRRARLHATSRHVHAARPATAADPLAVVRGREALHAIRRAVDAQPSPYREVLHLHLFEGLAPNEIAQRLGLGRVRVRVRLSRAMRRLRCALPDALALMLLVALTRKTAGQSPLWLGGVATALVVSGALSMRDSEDQPALAAPMSTSSATTTTTPTTRPSDPLRQPVAVRTLARVNDTVQVVVLDAHGHGLPGVGVTLAPHGGVDPLLGERRATTDAEGHALFAGISDGLLRVSIDRGGQGQLDTRLGRELRLRVTPGTLVRGRVVDTRGRALAGARIWLAGPQRQRRDGAEVTTTAGDGSFELRDVSAGSVLAVRADGYAGLPMRGIGTGELGDLTLTRLGGAIEIEVVDAHGQALADAAIVLGHAEFDTLPQDESLALTPPFTARADGHGRWGTNGIEPGYLPLFVRATGHTPHCATVSVTAGALTRMRVALQPGAQLIGRVTDAHGKPVADSRIACRSDATFTAIDARTDRDGRFQFAAVPRSEVGLLVWAPHCDVLERVLTIDRDLIAVNLQVVQNRRRRGVVLTAGGDPLANWQLALPINRPRSVEDEFQQVTTDAQGEVEIDVSSRADWSQLLMRPLSSFHWAHAVSHLEDQADGSFIVHVPNAMLAAGSLRGRARDMDGAPIGNALLFVHEPGTSATEVGRTDAEGHFRFDALPVGTYELSLRSPQPHQPGFDLPTVRIVDREQSALEITAPPSTCVRYQLQFPSGGQPHAPVITIESKQDHRVRAQRFGATGEQTLVPGDYTLAAMGDDFVWRTISFVVKADTPTALNIDLTPATRRQFSLRHLPVPDHGGSLRGRFFDRTTGHTLYAFGLQLDQAFALPLTSYLPFGAIGFEATTGHGDRLHAEFEVADLQPSFTALHLPFVLTPQPNGRR